MQTFIKKISRNSEFSVVIPSEIKIRYGFETGDSVVFEVARIDTGEIVLSSFSVIENLNDDTSIVVPMSFFDPRYNDGKFENGVVYDFRIISYGSDLEYDGNPAARFYDAVFSMTRDIFGMETRDINLVFATLYFNGGLFVVNNGENLLSQASFVIAEDCERFVVRDEFTNPLNFEFVGCDPILGSSNGYEFLTYEPSLLFDGESSEWYIPNDHSSSDSKFVLQRTSWKYGIRFHYPTNVGALRNALIGNSNSEMFMLPQQFFWDDDSIMSSTSIIENAVDYFEGFSFICDGSSSIQSQYLADIISQVNDCGNSTLSFLSNDYYGSSISTTGFQIAGVSRFNDNIGEYNLYSVQMDDLEEAGLQTRIIDQILWINKNGMFNLIDGNAGSFETMSEIRPGDILEIYTTIDVLPLVYPYFYVADSKYRLKRRPDGLGIVLEDVRENKFTNIDLDLSNTGSTLKSQNDSIEDFYYGCKVIAANSELVSHA